MVEATERLKAELSQLSERDRAAIAQFLIRSRDPEMESDYESAWDRELEERMSEIRSGTAIGEPAEQVFRELREKHS